MSLLITVVEIILGILRLAWQWLHPWTVYLLRKLLSDKRRTTPNEPDPSDPSQYEKLKRDLRSQIEKPTVYDPDLEELVD